MIFNDTPYPAPRLSRGTFSILNTKTSLRPSPLTKVTMIKTDDLEVIRSAFASFSLDSNFTAPFTDKYVTRESINEMYDGELFRLLVLEEYVC